MTRLKKLILVSIGLLLFNFSGNAQLIPGASGYDEVTLLSAYSDPGGSTRMIGIGGAQNALGGDIGSVMANPAGLGFYNRSEFSFTPSFSFRDVRAKFDQTGFDDFTSRFSFSNIGFVFNNTRDNISSGAWRGGSFGISLSKLADFNSSFHWEGIHSSSILDLFASMAHGQTPSQLPDQALHAFAYKAYLISPMSFYEDGGAENEYAPIVFSDQFPVQSETVDTRGSHYQLTFGYGGNFSDKFYFGANIGMGMLRYQAIKKYNEYFNISSGDVIYPDEYPEVDFTIDEVMELNGIGINGSLGIIYRPNNIIRLGASITSPTFYNFRDERTGDLFVDYGQWFEDEYYDDYEINGVVVPDTAIYSDLILSNYSVRTPTKLSGGVAVFFGKSGFLSADIDYLNYGGSRFSSRDFETGGVNTDINNFYQNTINYRVGGEYRVNIFRLRAGYAVSGDPYASNTYDRTKTTISGGAGIRLQSFFFDLAYQHSDFSNVYYPYDGGFFGAPIEVNNKVANLSATVGFTF